MRKPAVVLSAFVFTLCCSVLPGMAFDDYTDSIKCGSTFVMEGASKYEVLTKCGEPNMKEVVGATGGGTFQGGPPRRRPSHKDSSASLVIEEWTYDKGPTDFVYTLIFEGSRLSAVKRGSRGGGR
jgi:hypothetical protein